MWWMDLNTWFKYAAINQLLGFPFLFSGPTIRRLLRAAAGPGKATQEGVARLLDLAGRTAPFSVPVWTAESPCLAAQVGWTIVAGFGKATFQLRICLL